MNRRLLPGEKAFGYILFLFSLFLFYESYKIAGFSSISSAGGWPMAASAVMVVCSLLIIGRNRRMPQVEVTGALHALRRFGKEILPPHPLLGYVAIIVAYMLALEPIGFNVSSFLFLLASFWYLHRKGLVLALALSLGSVAAIYVTFQVIFRVILPAGDWLDLSVIGLGS